MFNPFFNPYRVRRIDQGGIPTLDTIFSNVDTTNNTVTYGICPFQWRQLPCRGLILLNINHTALKKKQQVSMMKKWRSVKIFQINQKHRQKILQ